MAVQMILDWFSVFWDLVTIASACAFILLIGSCFLWLLDKI